MNQSRAPPTPTLEQLRHVANHFPIIDGHAHNLILPTHADTIPFESITTEAQGRALRDSFKSLPHLRAARQLRHLYECGEDSDWEDLLEQRVEWLRTDPERFHKRCFEGVHALVIDEGLVDERKVYPFDSHDEYFQAPSKRIVRVESVAERLMERLVRDAKDSDLNKTKFLPELWVEFTDEFEREIQEAVRDPEVACLKTVVCYRTGLDIEPDYEEAAKAVGHPFERYVKTCIRKRIYRIERKPLNDYLVLRTLEILSDSLPHPDSLAKPLQFHTGLGDNDINLWEANPAYLQQVIEAYPSVPFVLLHSAYPYTQEAGYLATVYRHVYLDIGEIFPMVSRDGQQTVLRQAMEIVPGSKVLYSSSGHWFPESFYLANIQFREVWLDLLLEYVQKGDITTFQAIAMTKDIMFNNANNLYNLRYQPIFNETPQETPKQIAYKPKPATEPSYQSSGIPPIPPAGATMQPATFGPVDPRSGSPYAPPSFPPPPTVPHVYEDQTLDRFMKQYSDVRFVYVQWLDYTSKTQTRIIPMKEFSRMIREHDRISVSHDSTGIRHNELQTSAGQIYIEPDLRSLRRTNPKDPLPSAAVLSYWRSESGVSLPSCPRTSLESIINTLQYTHATTLLVGFELTVAFLATRATNHDPPIASPPPFPSAILLALDATGIDVLQCHATSAPGEFIFHLAPQPPLLAADTLLQARDTIARMHDGDVSIRTPLMSFALSPATHDEAFFLGGVRAHAPALAAFSSASVSRDAVLRTTPGRWNVAYADGSANMYVALAAVIAAGMLGLQAGEHEFAEQQIGRDAVGALRGDTALREVLGEEIVRSVIEGRESMSEVPRERGIERGFERQGERGYERIDERGYERGVETMRENERVPERRDEIWSEIRHEAERRIPGTDRGFDRPVERRDERMEPNARGAEMAGGRDTSSAERGALSGIDRGMERRDQRWDERTGENERDIRRGAEMGTGRDASGVERGISGIEQGDQRGFERQGDQRERVLPAVGMPLSGAGVQGAGGHDAGIPGAGTQGRGFEARDENPHERERVLPVVGMPPGVGVQGVGGYSVGIPGAVMPVEQLDQRQHERHDERRDQRETRLPNVAREDESSEEDESEDTSEDERPRPGRSVQRDV